MKNQALFSSKDKSKKLKCRLLQLLFSALRVNTANAKTVEFASSIDPDDVAYDELPHLYVPYLSGYKTGCLCSRMTSNN